MGRELSDQAGSGFGGETDADPVGAGADVDAGGVGMMHGQRFHPGGLLPTKGFALGLGPGLATVRGSALSAGSPRPGIRWRPSLVDRRQRQARGPRRKDRTPFGFPYPFDASVGNSP